MPRNNIDFNLNFKKGDISGLESLKKDLANIKTQVSNPDWALDIVDFKKIMPTIDTLQKALAKAFDPQLNTINIQKFNQILSQSGLNAKTLQENLSLAGSAGNQAFLKLTAQLMQFNTATKQTNKFLDTMATSFFNTLRWTALSSIVHSMGGEIQKSYYYVKDLDRALNDIRIVTGKNADEMERFAESANDAAKQLAVTTKDYTKGSLIYYQQGLSDDTVKTLTDITAMTSNVTGQSMEKVSEQLTAVWNGYQVANEAAKEGMQVYQEYVDKMAAVGATTASDLQELSVAMSKVASAASAMGVSFDDLNAQIATIVSVTRQAPEQVGTALKTIYARLGDLKVDGADEFGTKLGEVSTQLQTMGVNILDTNGDMRDMSSVMAEVAAKWDTWTSAQRQAAAVAMAGKRQYNNLVALFDNWDMYGEALETSMEAAGTLEKQQEIALDSLANKMDILTATAEDFYDSLLDEKTIKNAVEGLTKIVDLLADFTDATGGLNNLLPLLGATVMKVFNQQIAEGLSTVIMNARNAKTEIQIMEQNAAALQAMFSNSSLYQKNNNDDNVITAQKQGLQELQAYYNNMQKYQSIMTTEQKEEYNNLLNIKEQAGSLNIELETQKNYWLAISKKLQVIRKEYIQNMDVEKINEGVLKTQQLINGIEEEIKRMPSGTKKTRDELESLLNGLSGDFGTTEINAVLKRFNQLNAQGLRPTKEVLSIIINELKQVGNGANDILKTKNSVDSLNESFENTNKKLLQGLDLKLFISNITRAVGGIGQLAMGINILSNIRDIWRNEDLDFGDKLSQGFMNATMSLGMLKNGLQSFNAITDLTITQIEGLTAAKEAQIAADKVAAAQLELESAKELEIRAKRNILVGEENNLEAVKIIGEQQLSIARQEIAKKEILLNNAEVISTELNAKAKAEAAMASKGFSAAKVVESAKILLNKSALDAETAASMTNVAIKNVALAVTLALTAAIIVSIKIREKQIKQQIEANKKELENIKVKEEEVKTNNELVDSYKKLLEQQAKGEKVQESLYQKAMEVAEAYDIQGASILATAGAYEELTEKIKEKQIQESKENKSKALEGAEIAAETMILQASGGTKRGIVGSDKVSYTQKFGRKTVQGMETAGFNVSDMGGHTQTVSWNVDYTDPEAVKEFADQVDYMVEYSKESGDKSGLEFFRGLQKKLAETLPDLEEQLDAFYTETINIAFDEIDLTATQSTAKLNEKIQQIRQQVLDSGEVPEDEIDKYIDKYLSSISSIQKNLDKIDIAKSLTKDNEEIDKILEKLDTFSDSELAYLSVHLNGELLDKELGDWIKDHEPIISLLKERGASTIFKSTLSNYNEKVGFTSDTVNSLFAEGSSTADYLPSKEDFQMSDTADQYDIITRAMIESTKAAVEHKDIVVDTLTTERTELENWQVVYNKASEDAENNIKSLTENNKDLKDDYEDIYQLAIKLANGDEELGGSYDALLSKIEHTTDIDEEQLKAWGEKINRANENKKAIKTLTNEIESAENAEINYKNNIEELNKVLGYHSKVMDDIQTAYSNLTNMVDDYKETGHWTVDNVQKLIEMDDKYVATLEMENGTLALNDETFQKLALAKIDDMRITILSTAQQKLQALASLEQGEAAIEAANAIVKTALATAQLSDTANQSMPTLQALANTLDEIAGNYGKTSDRFKAGQNILKAAQNELAALDDVANQIGKGGDAMKKALHTGKESKGSKDKKDKELLKLEEEFDRYWEIHKALDQTDRDMKKLDKDQENLHGYELIRSLKQENELLANQAELYEQLAVAQEAEAAELRGTLVNSGIVFDASGAVINYAQATAEALKKYNEAITAYNQGKLDDAALEIHKQNYERFKKDLERYDKLFYSEMKETQEKLDEIRRKTLANNLKAWEVEIQLKLDFKELRREWNDFIKEVTSDFKKVFKDLRVEMKNMLKDAKTYIGDDGTIGTIIDAIHTVTGEIDKMMGGGTSDMFESVSQAQEKLKELNSQLQEAGKALHDLWKEAWDAYLDGIDQVADKFDDLMDRFEKINDELEFQGKLIELLYGDEAYQLMSKLYEGQLDNTKAQVQSLKQQADMWKEMFDASGATMENQADWTEDQKKYYEQWMEAQGKLNDMIIQYIELLKKDYLNTVKATLQQFEKFLTNGKGISKVREEWERIKENSEKYYDNVEKSYQIQTLANKIDQSIADSNNLQAQQKLMKFREKELSYLREKEKLTEYDIKAAEARYQIALKEIALQDAQNNKTSMKLTRNEQGNWSYQYVADEEDVASKQQDLLDAYNQLYQLASDAYEANLEAMIDLYDKYYEKAIEIAQNDNLTQQEKEEALKALWEQYYADLEELASENALYRNDLAQSGAMLLKEIYLQDQEAVQGMTEAERELINNLVNSNIDDYMSMEEAFVNNYNNIRDAAFEVMAQIREDWSSAAQEIADLWNADNGSSVKNQLQAAYNAIIEASKQYQEAVDECAKIVERDFSEEGITGAIDKAKDATDALKNKTIEMVNESIPYLNNLKNYVDQIGNAWKGVQQEILNTISLIDEYLRKIGEASSAASQQAGIGAGGGPSSGTPGGSGTDGDNNNSGGSKTTTDIIGGTTGAHLYDNYPGDVSAAMAYALSRWGSEHEIYNNGKNVYVDNLNTGGYTGSWNNGNTQGKLAFLHQKELVLNADDTKNFLSGINMIRQLSSGLNGSIENAVLKAAANTALSLGGIRSNPGFGNVSNNSNTDNVFNITAEFPNANSVDDIREAILSLPNLASQYINSNLR